MPDWSILMATVGARNKQSTRMLRSLATQVDRYGGAIEVVVYWDNFETTLGNVRQSLLDDARGDYVCFVDDDDEIPSYYCDKVMPLLGDVDYVGWRMQLYVNGVAQKPTFHSLRYDRWWDDADGYYRHVSHLNPIRRDLATLGRFDKAVPEDVDWAHQVQPYVQTEAYIDDVMYLYRSVPKASLWALERKPTGDHRRPDLPSPNFRYHPASSRGIT